jgi:hypothetical protein
MLGLVRIAKTSIGCRRGVAVYCLLTTGYCLLAAAGGGCIGKHPENPAATQPVTNVDPALATHEYWLAQPGKAEVAHGDFTTLWEASEDVARQYLFSIDRRNFRSGLLTTKPLVSKQWFEPWRKDAVTVQDVKEASLATIRRTVYFQFKQNPAGGYTVEPKVVVERESKVDPKYRDPDSQLPPMYWYAVRRDPGLEEKLAESIRKKLEVLSAKS